MTGKLECNPNEDGCLALRKAVSRCWNKITGTALALILAFGAGSYLFGADIITMVKNAPKTEQKIETHETRITQNEMEIKAIKEWKNEDKQLKEKLITLLTEIKNEKESKHIDSPKDK